MPRSRAALATFYDAASMAFTDGDATRTRGSVAPRGKPTDRRGGAKAQNLKATCTQSHLRQCRMPCALYGMSMGAAATWSNGTLRWLSFSCVSCSDTVVSFPIDPG